MVTPNRGAELTQSKEKEGEENDLQMIQQNLNSVKQKGHKLKNGNY